jgi:Cadherin-like
VFVNLDKLSISSTEEIRLDIAPLNDHSPQLIIKNPMDIWVGTSAVLNSDNLEVLDEDSDANLSAIIYHINASDTQVSVDNQGMTAFTALQLTQSQVRFMPRNENVSGLPLYATDGKLMSELVVLPIRVLDLRLSVSRNETIEVGRNSSLVITSDELDITGKKFSLKEAQEVGVVVFKPTDLLFEITEEPKFGYTGMYQK